MNKIHRRVAMLSGLLFLICTSVAMALPIAGDSVTVANGPYGTTAGGEFLLDIGDDGTDDYISFCVEYNEHINYSSTFFVESVEDYAHAGGISGATDGKDYLAEATKWIFWNYLQGTDYFAGKTYDNALANDVQKTIWELEGETSGWSDTAYTSELLTYATGLESYTIQGGTVKVLNLISKNGTLRQSQVIAEPVPEPATMILFGTGLVGLSGLARKRKKK